MSYTFITSMIAIVEFSFSHSLSSKFGLGFFHLPKTNIPSPNNSLFKADFLIPQPKIELQQTLEKILRFESVLVIIGEYRL